jgi:hypothetical protein
MLPIFDLYRAAPSAYTSQGDSLPMKTATLFLFTLVAASPAYADFSYTSTAKSGAATPPQSTKHYIKGSRMMMDSANTSTILDFEAQTITSINKSQKTYSVTPFADLGGATKTDINVDAKIDVKETGQRKTINGYSASEMVMTMSIDAPQAGPSGMKMELEMDMWLSADVPGSQELKAFHEKYKGRFPYGAMAGGRGNAGMQKGMADMQEKMASLGGIPVLQVTRMKGAAGSAPQMPQMSPAQQQQMEQARAKMEEMAKQGGAQGAAAQQALARMGAMMGAASGSGSLFETTTETSDFSTGSISGSVFEIPTGYRKTDRK